MCTGFTMAGGADFCDVACVHWFFPHHLLLYLGLFFYFFKILFAVKYIFYSIIYFWSIMQSLFSCFVVVFIVAGVISKSFISCI